MRATGSEQTLRRILAWLRFSGWELTPQLEQGALQALAEAVASGDPDLFGASLELLQRDPALAADPGDDSLSPHRSTPPRLRRASIAYGSY